MKKSQIRKSRRDLAHGTAHGMGRKEKKKKKEKKRRNTRRKEPWYKKHKRMMRKVNGARDDLEKGTMDIKTAKVLYEELKFEFNFLGREHKEVPQPAVKPHEVLQKFIDIYRRHKKTCSRKN